MWSAYRDAAPTVHSISLVVSLADDAFRVRLLFSGRLLAARLSNLRAPGLTATRRISGSSHQNKVTTLNGFTPQANRVGLRDFKGF